MNKAAVRIGELVAPVLAVALCWVVVFKLNAFLFSSLEQSRWVHWIFLPAAVRVLAVLLLGRRGAVGLVLGALFTLSPQDVTMPNAIILPLTSGLAPWLAVCGWKRLFRVRDDLFGIHPLHIVFLSVGCAIANGALLNLGLFLSEQAAGGGLQMLAIMTGDAFGTAIILFLLSVALSSSRRQQHHH